MTNWYVGKRIKEDVLYNQRAEYGKQVIKNLSLKLVERYGSGWSNAETIDMDALEKSYLPKIKRYLSFVRKNYVSLHHYCKKTYQLR